MRGSSLACSCKFTFAAIAATALLGCYQPTNGEGAEETAARAQIDELRSRYEQTIAAGDFDALRHLLHEDAIMVFPSGAVHDDIRATADGAPFPPGAEIDITPIELVIINQQWAYEFGTSAITYSRPGSAERIVARDTYLILFRNIGDGWKVFREVASANPPGEHWPEQLD